ncbi:MAG: VWA domain-containing protein [Spirochaetia bacterium]
MIFEQPAMLWALFGILPVAFLSVRAYYLGLRDLRRIMPTEDLTELERVLWVKSVISTITAILVFTSLVFALAEPVWGEEEVESDREQLDVSIAFDVSRSMYASDYDSTRLERARDAVAGIIERFPESRTGFTAFRGAATQVLPVTDDRVAFDYVLESASPPMITSPGTNVAEGIRTALRGFPEGSNRHSAVLLVSDGEALSGDAVKAAEEAAELSIPIFVFGIGDPEGSRIPLPGGEFVRDSEGDIVLASLDEEGLRNIAEVSRGRYVNLRDPDAGSTIADELELLERGEGAFRIQAQRRYGLFAALALFFVLIHLITRAVRWRDTF